MRRLTLLALACVIGVLSAACSRPAGTLEAATEALGAAELQSIEYSGTGRWFQFGQAPSPTLPWPQFDVSSFTATVNYQTPAARVQMTRRQTVEPGRTRPAPVEQRPGPVRERHVRLEHGRARRRAARRRRRRRSRSPPPSRSGRWRSGRRRTASSRRPPANNATSQPAEGGSDVSFTADGAPIRRHGSTRRTRWSGCRPGSTTRSSATRRSRRRFPTTAISAASCSRDTSCGPRAAIRCSTSRCRRSRPTPRSTSRCPRRSAAFTPPAVRSTVDKLADGVYYLRGGTHHSLAIDQADHIVVVEGPQSEARSNAVIAKVKETIPNKPIRYVINTHVHFDHSGGLRTFVDEGATVVTHAMNRPYYEQAWAAPRTLNPDRLAQVQARAPRSRRSPANTC